MVMCDDGIARPVFRAELLASDGAWRAVEFLADIGADRTVLTADILSELGLPLLETEDGLSGLGGGTDSVELKPGCNCAVTLGIRSSSPAGLQR
jgi:hypothetical protein